MQPNNYRSFTTNANNPENARNVSLNNGNVNNNILMNALERLWEPCFIYDSYDCRKGKEVKN